MRAVINIIVKQDVAMHTNNVFSWNPVRKLRLFHLITCFRHFDILAKTRCGMTTATTFSRQNDAGSRASTT